MGETKMDIPAAGNPPVLDLDPNIIALRSTQEGATTAETGMAILMKKLTRGDGDLNAIRELAPKMLAKAKAEAPTHPTVGLDAAGHRAVVVDPKGSTVSVVPLTSVDTLYPEAERPEGSAMAFLTPQGQEIANPSASAKANAAEFAMDEAQIALGHVSLEQTLTPPAIRDRLPPIAARGRSRGL